MLNPHGLQEGKLIRAIQCSAKAYRLEDSSLTFIRLRRLWILPGSHPGKEGGTMMRSYSLVAGLLMLTGCSSGGDWTSGSVDGTGTPVQTGKVTQKSQFADATIVNLVDPLSATLALTADGTPITVQ